MKSIVTGRVDALARTLAGLRADPRSTILGAVALGWFLSLGVRMIFPVLLPTLREIHGLGLGAAGLLLSVLWGAYAIGQLPAGLFSDRFGERAVLAVSTVVSAAVLFLVVIATDPVVLFVTTALFGFATALYGVARFTAVSKLFPESGGVAIGATLAAGNLGNVILPATAGVVAAATAWQFGFGFAIPLFVIVGIVLWVVVPTDLGTGGGSTPGVSMATIRRVLVVLRRPEVALVTVVVFLGYSVWGAFTGFYPTYLIERKGLSPTIATGLFSLFFALSIVVQPVAGAVYDRFGIRTAIPIFLGVAVAGLVLLPMVEGLPALVGVTVLLSCLTSNIAVTTPYLTSRLPEAIQGTGLGTIRTAYMLVGALSPTAFGLLAGAGHFDTGFFVLAVFLGANIVLIILLPLVTEG